MATDLKILMDRAVAGLSLPPQLAEQAANGCRRRRRQRRFAGLATVAGALAGLIVWLVIGATPGSNVSTLIPSSPKPVPIPMGVVIPPSDRVAAPSLAGSTLTGNRLDLSSLRGDVVAVNFWGSWCAPCRSQAPVLEQVYAATERRGVAFVGVDERDTESNAQSFDRAHGVTYPSIFDGDGSIAAQWPGAAGPPYTFIVDRQGRIAALFLGSVTATQLQDALARVAAEFPTETIRIATRHESFQDADATLDPPGAGQAPPDPTAAWRRIEKKLPGNVCLGAKNTIVEFALFTSRTDGYNKVPEWVVRCADEPAAPGAGPIPPNAPQATPTADPTPLLMDMITIFDGRTGKLLIGFNEPPS